MKRIFAVGMAAALVALFPAGASATAGLSKAEAKAASTGALQRYYGDTWRYGTNKEVGYGSRISRTRWALSYQFEYEPGQACYGEVVAWRGRYGRIFTDVRPNPELSAPCL